MSPSLLIFGGLAVIVALAVLAKRVGLPYPIVFVLGGVGLALVPGLPTVSVEPDWIFFTVLPPLLFSGGWSTDWLLFRQNLRPIGLLAIGLVITTTLTVAIAINAIVPGFGWAAAFVLGAIVAPPDAVAAGAVFERFTIPRRIAAILDGEGLVNDGSALVIYRFAVAAVVTGSFSMVSASAAFVAVAVGGVVAGIVIAAVIEAVSRILDRISIRDSMIDNLVLLVAPYVAYFSAESIHVSGVLATVAAGLILGRRSSTIFEPETRLIGTAVWQLLDYLLNGTVFLLIGLELRRILASSLAERWIPIALLISLLVIIVRFAWVIPATYLPRLFSKSVRENDPVPSWRFVFVIAWTGLRGIVSLAAALALPLHTAAGAEFPQREPIIIITFVVIVVTLVGQGLSLMPILAWLKIEDVPAPSEQREDAVRITALEAGLRRLHDLETPDMAPEQWETLGRSQAEYRNRIKHLKRHQKLEDAEPESPESRFDHYVQDEALAAERAAIMLLRAEGRIPDDIFREVQYDLDLAAARLQ